MAYRNDLDALVARKTALEDEVRDRTQELEGTRRLVDELEARKRLPVLDNIRVAAPCSASWDQMVGDGRVRACAECNKNVYNLSDMTRDEAEAVIRETEGRLCVRYFERADGTILLKDCEVGVKRRRRRRVVAVGAAAGLAASLFGYRQAQRESYTLGQMKLETPVELVEINTPPALPAPPHEPLRATTGAAVLVHVTPVPPRPVMGVPPRPVMGEPPAPRRPPPPTTPRVVMGKPPAPSALTEDLTMKQGQMLRLDSSVDQVQSKGDGTR